MDTLDPLIIAIAGVGCLSIKGSLFEQPTHVPFEYEVSSIVGENAEPEKAIKEIALNLLNNMALIIAKSAENRKYHQVFFGTPHQETSNHLWESTILRMISYLQQIEQPDVSDWLPRVISTLSLEHRRISRCFESIKNQYRIVQYVQDPTSPNVVLPSFLARLGCSVEETIFVNVKYERLTHLAGRVHRDRYLNLQRESCKVAEPEYCSFLKLLHPFVSYSPVTAPQAGLFSQTVKALFSQDPPKEWLLADASGPLILQVPQELNNIDFLSSLSSHISEVRRGEFQRYIAIPVNPTQFYDSVSATVLCNVIHHVIKQQPLLCQNIQSLFSVEELSSAFCGKSACLLEPVLWRCFMTLLSANTPIACLLLVNGAEADSGMIKSFLERMASLPRLIDCSFKLLILHNEGAAITYKSPAITSRLDIADVHIKESITSDVSRSLDLLLIREPELVAVRSSILNTLPTLHSNLLLLISFIHYINSKEVASRFQLEHDLKLLSGEVKRYSSVSQLIPDSAKTRAHETLLVLAHAFKPLTIDELRLAVAITARYQELFETFAQDLIPSSIDNDVPTYPFCLVPVDADHAYLDHRSLNNLFDHNQPTDKSWYQPCTQPHFAMAKLCLQCIALYYRSQAHEAQSKDELMTGTDQEAENFVLFSPGRRPIQLLVEYAVLNWPLHFLQAISDNPNQTDFAEIISLLSDVVVTGWLRRWIELRCPLEPHYQPSLRLSPLCLQANVGLSVDSALKVSLHALESLVALEMNEDLALVWGLSKAVGFATALKFWRDEVQEKSKDPHLLMHMFGLDPQTAFELLLSIDQSFFHEHLAHMLSLDISFGGDNVLRYINQNQNLEAPTIHEEDGKVFILAKSLSEATDSQDIPRQKICLYNKERQISAVGLAEFFCRATEGLGAFFRDSNVEVFLTTIHAAVASGNADAIDALMSLGRDVDDRGHAIANAISLASKYGFSRILEQLLLQKVKSACLHYPDKDDLTPLHLAARNGFTRVAGTLISHGASATAKDGNGATPFLAAVNSGNLKLIQHFLEDAQQRGGKNEQGDDNNNTLPALDEPDNNQLTPLISALDNGFLEIASLLMENNAKVDVKDSRGYTPMCLAAEKGFSDLLGRILEHHVHQHSEDDLKLAALETAVSKGHAACVSVLLDRETFQPGIIRALLGDAVHENHVEVIKILLKRKPTHGALSEPFLYAAIHGNVEIIDLLLDAGADKDYQDSDKNTALQIAAFYGKCAAVKTLLLRRVDLDLKDSSGRTALCDAARRGFRKIVKLLLDAGADFNAKDKNGMTALDLAEGGQSEKIDLLLCKIQLRNLEASEEPIEKDKLLQKMISRGSFSVAEYLLHEGANPSPGDLQVATKTRNVGLVSLLLRNGADPNWVVDEESGPPIHYAAYWCDARLVEVLLDGSHPKGKANVNKTGGLNWSALYACIDGLADDHEKIAMFNLLVDNGADYSDLNGPRGTVLHNASRYCSKLLVEYLLENFGDKLSPHREDREGRLPAHFAASRGNRHIFSLVLDPVLGQRDKQGRMPIHMAAAGGSIQALNYILEKSSVEMLCERDIDGWNVLHWACRQRDKEVVVWILDQVARNDSLQLKLSSTREKLLDLLPWDVAVNHNNERFLDIFQTIKEKQGNALSGVVSYQRPFDIWLPTPAGCDSCFCPIYGKRHKCMTCIDFDLCFKCFRHANEIHDKEHEFQVISS
ncbi:hypothetical protein AAE478_007497 [Parahypoxylon ruwenzoriense]